MRIILFISISLILALLPTVVVSGQSEAIISADTLLLAPVREHSVRKATLKSTALPGLGQAYNRKYWKVPIVYAGLGACVYFIRDNTVNYRYYRDALFAETDGNPATINPTGATAAQIRPVMDQYRQWLDLSYIGFVIVYALNIVDAHVDAHLFNFDVSEDLQASIRPAAITTTRINAGISLTINF